MTPVIYVKEEDLPTTIAAYTVRGKDDEYTVILNARMSTERLREAYNHELAHIRHNDFDKPDMELVECEAHRR